MQQQLDCDLGATSVASLLQQSRCLVLYNPRLSIVRVAGILSDDGLHFVADEERQEYQEEDGEAEHEDAQVVLMCVVQIDAAFVPVNSVTTGCTEGVT